MALRQINLMENMSVRTIFLSSTGAELRDYRQKAFEAISKLDDWKRVRMEDFLARTQCPDCFLIGRFSRDHHCRFWVTSGIHPCIRLGHTVI